MAQLCVVKRPPPAPSRLRAVFPLIFHNDKYLFEANLANNCEHCANIAQEMCRNQ